MMRGLLTRLEGSMSMANIRWRLVMGLASMIVTLILTFPAAAGQFNRVSADIWPNGPLADIMPAGAPAISGGSILTDIWPN